jgi:ribosomal-protein-alanine N-acetyltransferase
MTFRISGQRHGSVPTPTDDAVIELERMRRRHVRSVLAIEERIFPRPWSQALYLSELAQPATRFYSVALVGGDVVGYIGCMLVVGEGHITTVGVAPEWHRRGIGTRLLHRAASEAREQGATSLTLEVRVSNHGAQELYRAFGFVPAGIRKNYYAEVNEDGLVMWASDVDTPAYGARLAALLATATAPRQRRPSEGHDRDADR